jgi:hypothetical protein
MKEGGMMTQTGVKTGNHQCDDPSNFRLQIIGHCYMMLNDEID